MSQPGDFNPKSEQLKTTERLLTVLEFLALFCLGASGLISPILLFLSLFVLSSIALAKESFAEKWQRNKQTLFIIGLLFYIPASVYLIFLVKVGSIEVGAQLACLLFTLLWLIQDRPHIVLWRLLTSLLCLVLSALSSQEWTLFVLNFVYFIVLLFYLARRSDRKVSTVAALILAFFVLLFTTLVKEIPRSKGVMPVHIGYTETARLSGDQSFFSASNPALVMRIEFLHEHAREDASLIFPLNLLKTRVLEDFNLSEWRPKEDAQSPQPLSQTPLGLPKLATLRITREALPTPFLTLPYGTTYVSSYPAGAFALFRTKLGEVIGEGTKEKKIQFEIAVQPVPNMPEEALTPEEIIFLTRLPEISAEFKEAIDKLSHQVFGEHRSAARKMLSLEKYFQKLGGYSAGLSLRARQFKDLEDNAKDLLFASKKGHCERFASAATLILRHNQIPARLVSGFRLSSGPIGNKMVVRQEDAHVWVEAWDPRVGWLAIDPTPVDRSHSFSPEKWLRYFRDWLDANLTSFQEILDLFVLSKIPFDNLLYTLTFCLMILLGIRLRRSSGDKSSSLQSELWQFEKRSSSFVNKTNNRDLLKIKKRMDTLDLKEDEAEMIKIRYEELRFGAMSTQNPDWKKKVRELSHLIGKL